MHAFTLDATEAESPEPRQEQVDPIIQEKYHEKLYTEVSAAICLFI